VTLAVPRAELGSAFWCGNPLGPQDIYAENSELREVQTSL